MSPKIPGAEQVSSLVGGMGVPDARAQDQGFLGRSQDAVTGIHRHHVMPCLPQGLSNLSPRRQGHFPLPRDPTHQDGDLQGASSWFVFMGRSDPRLLGPGRPTPSQCPIQEVGLEDGKGTNSLPW